MRPYTPEVNSAGSLPLTRTASWLTRPPRASASQSARSFASSGASPATGGAFTAAISTSTRECAILRTLCRGNAATLPVEEELDDPGDDEGRGFRPLVECLQDHKALRSESSTGRRIRAPFAIPTRKAGFGCSSTAMRRAGRTSSPTPRFQRSFKKPGTRVGSSWRKSPASSTASSRPGPHQGHVGRCRACQFRPPASGSRSSIRGGEGTT
jgi:hypothetical protein